AWQSSTIAAYQKHAAAPPQHQVFINFRGEDVGFSFASHLVSALLREGVNVFIDKDERRGEDFGKLFKKIEDSKIALVVFSSSYSESTWCLDELVEIQKRRDEGKLKVIPISYKVEPSQVQQLNGDFGDKLWNLWRLHRDHRIIKWKQALESVASREAMMRFWLKEDGVFVTSIVEEVKMTLMNISLQEGENPETIRLPTRGAEKPETFPNKDPLVGIEKHMEQLEQKLEFDRNETRIIGIVGMPGIGKTTLAMMLHEKWNCNFVRCAPLLGISKTSKDYGIVWLRMTLLKVLLGGDFPIIKGETTHKSVKKELLQTKVFVVLDDVSDKKQFEYLLGDLKWIKKGSKIVITTCDRSLLEGLAHDTYLVPQMDNTEAFQLFSYHARNDQISRTFLTLSIRFVENSGGNPLALKLLGSKLHEKDETQWNHQMQTMTCSFDTKIQDVKRSSKDQFNQQHKDDIACFSRSEDEYFCRILMDSGNLDSTDAKSEVRDLSDMFLIEIYNGRVDMNDLVYTFGKDTGSPGRFMLLNYKDITHKLKNMEKEEADNVRGIFIDMCHMSKVTKRIPLGYMTFANMRNLRYLKIYDSCCPRKCNADCILYFPEGLKFPLEEVRYLDWLKFPLEELPSNFRPKNLVNLRLPYSKIQRIVLSNETPKLKWVDLSHSTKLLNISALSKAENLLSLNLEGCTGLDELPLEIQNMMSLSFLNLRGCIRLCFLPEMDLISLKTLILTDCSSLKEFQLISKSIEFLHLDGTSIKGLPSTMKNLQRLVLLNMRNCKMLEFLPDCVCELKLLEELILSGCSMLKNFPSIKKSMKHLQILLFDGTGAQEMPKISYFTRPEGQATQSMFLQPFGAFCDLFRGVNRVSFLQRLCLSGNDFVSLETDIGQLYHLKWLDVKHCKKLKSLPLLPPRLQSFDAHACDSLEKIANPLALLLVTDQIHATFNFSNCYKLDQEAKDSIITYTRRKSQLVLDALSRRNGVCLFLYINPHFLASSMIFDIGIVSEALVGTCFPGWEVPAWFGYRASGSMLKPKLPPHWFNNRFTGIALCAVIQFPEDNDHSNLLVQCNCVFKNEDGIRSSFSCTIGGWSISSNIPQRLESSHVFIGYARRFDVHKEEERCASSETSLKFQVTDGMGEVVVGCEVLKCGFSLVYAPDERDNICWDARLLQLQIWS
ncbi:unnamed protein product, partial [Arabidopsis halleri]